MPVKKNKNDSFVPFTELYKNDFNNNNETTEYNFVNEKDNTTQNVSDYETSSEDEGNDLIIKPYKVKSNKIKINDAMEKNIIACHPFRLLLTGASASGKSQVVLNLMKKKNFYKNYFDIIFLISPTCNKDDTQKLLNINNNNTCSDLDNKAPLFLEHIFKTQNDIITENKGDISKCPKVLIILDDIISSKIFLNSPQYKNLLIAGRHSGISSITLSQKYNAIPRINRLNMSDIMLFPSSLSELDLVADEYCPPNTSKRDFLNLMQYATGEKYSFLYINMKSPVESRYRKKLDTIINVKN